MFAQGITAKWELHIPGTYLAEREPDISFPPPRTAVTEGWKVWSEHLYTQSCLQSIIQKFVECHWIQLEVSAPSK
jgi:uncharacterized protein YbdZ (MbtH family)